MSEHEQIVSWPRALAGLALLTAFGWGLLTLFAGEDTRGIEPRRPNIPEGAFVLTDASWGDPDPGAAAPTPELVDPFEREERERRRQLAEEARERWQNVDIAVLPGPGND